MEKSLNDKCKGHIQCERKSFSDGFCQFHLPNDHDKVLTCDEYDALLIKEVEEVVENEKGMYALYWHGFIFPKDHVLFGSMKFVSVRDRLAKSWINIQDSNIQSIQLLSDNVHQLILSRAIIHKNTMIGVLKIDRLSMQETRFLGKYHCASKTREFDARGAIFNDDFSFAAVISEIAIFNGCRFHKSCTFSGRAGVVFGGEKSDSEFKAVRFDNVIFSNPAETLFKDVDLRKASFNSVSLTGVRFDNTNFYQSSLGRNGLYNEVNQLQQNDITTHLEWRKNKPSKNVLKQLDHLIHEYRQLRRSMESNKNYIKAHDFYIGEMEAQQRREWSIVLAAYRLSSFYGTDFIRAFSVLLFLFMAHFCITILLSTDWQIQKLFCGSEMTAAWERLGDIVIHSLGVGTLQRTGLLSELSFGQKMSDIFFRILIPIQTAMFVLALRNKTKR